MVTRVLVTGSGGQLAWELAQTCPENIELLCLSAKELDITDKEAVMARIQKERPDAVINAAAYTAVDRAEEEVELAYAVNEAGSEHLALACREVGAKLVHVSTDFVFDGSRNTPYQPDDKPNPLNVYGASKLAGDKKIAEVLGPDAVIIRTAWVYSTFGNNFVKTMLRLMAEKEQLGIIYDQVGTPTWARGLALLCWNLSEKLLNGGLNTQVEGKGECMTLHWTDAGVASWYDFAIAIQELAIEKGMLSKAIPVRPIPASAYPTPATRPSFSVIDKSLAESISGMETVHWRKQLSQMLDEVNAH
ncbi:dTDP-4-dehydrorhamnose reductase [Ferrimonas balearica]|uniref:dTDP-4-dehydrorhamnose reductase n=1 Tax=Ferrimonas balearica TaxID=44012 RepID=UPI001C99B523|nr:dTDP-4-dehydrorhamnose reductase [Ferrimonas balearica]MBY5921261.1 dTDP-4-dehydrorhamnose reductase [Ferrimonas balearica]MBY5996054.1 dTDP-4-dehydrorhamnose reductase [Ferrimonas balearica]